MKSWPLSTVEYIALQMKMLLLKKHYTWSVYISELWSPAVSLYFLHCQPFPTLCAIGSIRFLPVPASSRVHFEVYLLSLHLMAIAQ